MRRKRFLVVQKFIEFVSNMWILAPCVWILALCIWVSAIYIWILDQNYKILSFQRVWARGGWVPQHLREISASVPGGKIMPTPWNLPDPINDLCSLPDSQLSKILLHIFQYKKFFRLSFTKWKKRSGGLNAAGSQAGPPHKIVRYRFYSSTWLRRSFPTDQNGQTKLICTSEVPAVKGQIGGAGP